MTELAATGVQADASTSNLDSLSPQELQIARAVGQGLNNVEASAALFVSRKTVEAHLTRAYRKLGVWSRTELTRLAGHVRPDVLSPDRQRHRAPTAAHHLELGQLPGTTGANGPPPGRDTCVMPK
jgi:DNA-binding CsgD family transcriptional regulator